MNPISNTIEADNQQATVSTLFGALMFLHTSSAPIKRKLPQRPHAEGPRLRVPLRVPALRRTMIWSNLSGYCKQIQNLSQYEFFIYAKN